MKGKISILIAIVVIIAAIIGFRILKSQNKPATKHSSPQKSKLVKVNTIRYQDIQSEIAAFGRVNSRNKIEIFSEVSGILQMSNPEFKEGNFVRSGQILVKVDERDARLNLYSLRSDLLNILVNLLPDIKSDFSESFNDWKAYLDSFHIEKPTPTLPKIIDEKEKYFVANRNVYKAYYGIKKAELFLSKHLIRAPFDGIITNNLIETGALIRIGQKIGEFRGINDYELELSVNYQDAEFVSVGDITYISSGEHQGEWHGKVVRINPNIDPNSQTIKVFIQINGSDLQDGMYMKARLMGSIMKQIFKIPRKAIFDKNLIYCVHDSSLVVKSVDIIRVDGKFAYIRGIDSLQMVVVESLINVSKEQNITPVISQKE